MPTLRSGSLDQFRHPNFSVDMASVHESEGEALIEYLEQSVRAGKRFNDGDTVNIGWGRLKLLADESGNLAVHEPSFKEMPIKWILGANKTYAHLSLQKQVCKEVGAEPDFPSLMQAGIVSEYMLEHSGPFQMDRHSGDGQGNSGWALYEIGKADAEGVKWVSLYQIGTIYPQTIPFFGLPQDAIVIYQIDRIQVAYGDREIDSNSNSFLQQLLSSKNYGSVHF